MLRLYIMRHAKSSWSIPGQTDFERGLNDRGKSDLPRLASFLRANKVSPQIVLCSSAVRTRKTLEGVEKALGEYEVEFLEEFYHGTAESYLAHVQEIPTTGDVMIIGHNPCCELLAHMLTDQGEPEALDEMAWKYPTGSIAILRFDCDNWSEIEEKSGYLEAFVQPKQLINQTDA